MEKRIILDQTITKYTIKDTGEVCNTDTNKILKGSITISGYQYIRLSLNGIKYRFYTHRLVAEYFIPNPNNLPILNHIDGNKLNNNMCNLEWISHSGNVKHAHETQLIKSSRSMTPYIENKDETEIWIPIKEYEDYLISDRGRVRSLKWNKDILLKPSLANGYYKVVLSKNNKQKDFLIAYLVYFNFVENANIIDGFVIDHIDGNKLNNELVNLRYISRSENVIASLYEQNSYSSLRKVACYKEGILVKTFNSCKEAGRELKLDPSSISKVCRGVYTNTHNYVFRYLD